MITYVRDVSDRAVARTEVVAGVSSTVRYGFTGPGDRPAATLTTVNVVTETDVGLPGGVLLTKRSAGDVWSYPNIHGGITVMANGSGTVTSTAGYDPFGNTASVPDNSAGKFDYGWLGQHQRPTDTTLNPTIEMGARPYNPTLARFLTVDPIEGGNTNDYTYVTDPINQLDVSGRCSESNGGVWGLIKNMNCAASNVIRSNTESIHLFLQGAALVAFAACIVVSAGACFAVSTAIVATSFLVRAADESTYSSNANAIQTGLDLGLAVSGFKYSHSFADSMGERAATRLGSRYAGLVYKWGFNTAYGLLDLAVSHASARGVHYE